MGLLSFRQITPFLEQREIISSYNLIFFDVALKSSSLNCVCEKYLNRLTASMNKVLVSCRRYSVLVHVNMIVSYIYFSFIGNCCC